MTDTRNADLTFGSTDYVVYMATINTAAPVGFADPSAAWTSLGWVSIDGGTLKIDATTKDIEAAGSVEPIRTLQVKAAKSIQATFQEGLNPCVRALYDNVPVESLNPTAGIVTYEFPDKPNDLRYAYVFDTFDGDKRIRLYAPNGMVDSRGDEQPQQGSEMGVQMTVKFYKGATAKALSRTIDYGAVDVSGFFPTEG